MASVVDRTAAWLCRLFGRSHTGSTWTWLGFGRGVPRDLRPWIDRRVCMTRRCAPRHATTAKSI